MQLYHKSKEYLGSAYLKDQANALFNYQKLYIFEKFIESKIYISIQISEDLPGLDDRALLRIDDYKVKKKLFSTLTSKFLDGEKTLNGILDVTKDELEKIKSAKLIKVRLYQNKAPLTFTLNPLDLEKLRAFCLTDKPEAEVEVPKDSM